MAQSTNDTIHGAINISALLTIEDNLLPQPDFLCQDISSHTLMFLKRQVDRPVQGGAGFRVRTASASETCVPFGYGSEHR